MKIHEGSLKIKFLFVVSLDEWWEKYVSEAGSQFE